MVALVSAAINPQLLSKCWSAEPELVLFTLLVSSLEFSRTAVPFTIHTMATLRLNLNAYKLTNPKNPSTARPSRLEVHQGTEIEGWCLKLKVITFTNLLCNYKGCFPHAIFSLLHQQSISFNLKITQKHFVFWLRRNKFGINISL